MRVIAKVIWAILFTMSVLQLHATDICGSVSGILSRADSPYVATCSISVALGDYLAIEDGVEIRFAPGTNFYIYGTVNFTGTELNPVVFTSNNILPAAGDWNGIRIEGIVEQFTHVIMRYSNGINVIATNPIIITNSTFEYDNYAVVLHEGTPLYISDSTFQHNELGLQYYTGARATVASSIFNDNYIGLQVTGEATNVAGSITGCYFDSNDSIGILCASSVQDSYVISRCTFDRNGYPVQIEDNSYPAMSDLTVNQNQIGLNGIFIYGVYNKSGALSDPGCPYICDAHWNLATTTLTLNKGVIFKGTEGISACNLRFNGTTTEPVVITSYSDDSYGGDTNNDGPSVGAMGDVLEVSYASAVINNAVIRYCYNGLHPNSPNSVLDVSGTLFEYCNYGINFNGDPYRADPVATITGCNFRDNQDFGIYMNQVGSNISISACTFDHNGYPIQIDLDSYPVLSNLTVNQNHTGYNGVLIVGGYETSGTLTNPGCPYICEAGWNPGTTLTIDEGTVIKSANVLNVYGLRTYGTSEQPVIFTSLWDDSYGGDTNVDGPSSGSIGDWPGIAISSSLSYLRHLRVLYAYTGLQLMGCVADIGWLEAKNCFRGVELMEDSLGYIYNSDFISNGTGVYLVDLSSYVDCGREDQGTGWNQFICNSVHIQNDGSSTVMAENNWWGAAPPDPSKFIGDVDYSPFLEEAIMDLIGGLILDYDDPADVHLVWEDLKVGCGYRVYRSTLPDQGFVNISGTLSANEFTDPGAGNAPDLYFYQVALD